MIEGIEFIRASRWVTTPPLCGGSAKGWFLNGVVLFEVSMTPRELLHHCRILEDALGRRRGLFWADRPLDLDILLVEGVVSDEPKLTLPHPAIQGRPFVLGPLLEVWPDAVNPRDGRNFASLTPPHGPTPARTGVVGLNSQGTPTLRRGSSRFHI